MWDIPNRGKVGTTTVYALLTESNNGQDGKLEITVVHPTKGQNSHNSVPADFDWNMDHITVTALDMSFPWG